MPTTRRIGVILAAGRGGRMGGTKQLKVWRSAVGEKPLVAAAFDAIQASCDGMVVVLGHEADAVAAALGERLFHRVESSPNAPMFESIRAGLRAANDVDSQATVVLQPGDHPEVAHKTLDLLVTWSLKRPGHTIIPEFGGRGGHPVLVPATVGQLVLRADCPEGLDKFWKLHPELCHRVAVNDPAILRDMDTPADLG